VSLTLLGQVSAPLSTHLAACRSLDEAAHRRGHEPATVVSDLDRRPVVEIAEKLAFGDFDARPRRAIEQQTIASRSGAGS
jgi:hypothetical protein